MDMEDLKSCCVEMELGGSVEAELWRAMPLQKPQSSNLNFSHQKEHGGGELCNISARLVLLRNLLWNTNTPSHPSPLRQAVVEVAETATTRNSVVMVHLNYPMHTG